MAYADAQSRKLNPASLTAAIAVNGVVLAALLTAAPMVEKVIPEAIDIFTPVERKPPEPLPEPPKPQPDRAAEAPLRTEPLIKTPPLPDKPVITLGDKPVIAFDPNPGTGDTPVIEPLAKPAPVMTGAEIDPRYMRDFQPSYPSSKIRLEQEGRVTVRILVGANGRVLQLQPVGNPDADFLAATRKQALSKWRFTPATRDGVPIEAWREISVRFELNS